MITLRYGDWDWQLYTLCAWQTQPEPLNTTFSRSTDFDSEKCEMSIWLHNSIVYIISLVWPPMVCWQQIGCYKMALSELRYKCINGLHVKGTGERCVSSDELTTILCSLQQSSVQNGILDYKITLNKALWCWALRALPWTETSSRDDRAGTKQAVDQTFMTYQAGHLSKIFRFVVNLASAEIISKVPIWLSFLQ